MTRVKFVCLNLWIGGKLFDDILDFLKKESPDILVVQEAYNSKDKNWENRLRSIEIFKKECNFPYNFFSPACIAVLEDKEVEAGNAIFSRFPIVKSDTIFFDVPFKKIFNYETINSDYSLTPRNLQHAVIKINNTNLNVFNTQGIWDKNREDTERRLKMANTIVDNIKGKENVILAGDFNVKPNTKSISVIEGHLNNIFKGNLKTTWNMRQKNDPVKETAVIDMVFVSKDIKIVDKYCPNVDISDHLPLVCIFEI